MSKNQNAERLGQSIYDYQEAQNKLGDKLRHIHELGATLSRLGNWLESYQKGRVAKEPLSDTLNVTEEVTILMAVPYPSSQNLIDLINQADDLVTRTKELSADIERLRN